MPMGWELKEGQYKTTNINEEKIKCIIKTIILEDIQRTTDYKYVFLKSLLDCIEQEKDNYKIEFKQLFNTFAKNYYEKYQPYRMCIVEQSTNKKSFVLKEYLEDEIEFIQGVSFYELKKRDEFLRKVEEIVSKYVIGALFIDTDKTFYSFSKKNKELIFNPIVYKVLGDNKEVITRANDYEWTRWIESKLMIKQHNSWNKPKGIENLVGRKQVDLSILENGETVIPKMFSGEFSIVEELEKEKTDTTIIKRDIHLLYQGKEYEADISKKPTGQIVLRIKTKALRNEIRRILKRSKEYIEKRLEPGKKKEIIVPYDQAEYLEFYETNRADCFEVKLCTNNLDIECAQNESSKLEDEGVSEKEVIEMPLERIYQEDELITSIHEYITNRGFQYSLKTIQNLYLSLKTKPFTILAGISGIGKSKIIELFAEAIGATTENGRYKLIAVRPDWSDSTELVGYKDLNNQFNPGVLTQIIEKAIKDQAHPYFICLDEMNLARVEYYFSDFLSLIESRKWKDNNIVTHPLIEQKGYESLYIPENLYIIGTVNMDETTYPFSKKVLDRANTIEFSEVNLMDGLDEIEQIRPEKLVDVSNNYMKSEYLSLVDCKDLKEETRGVIQELIEVNQILEQGNLHFAYRVRDEIVFYMLYNMRFNLMSYEEAFEMQLLQKILPRITGSSSKIMNILEKLKVYTKERYPKAYEKVLFMIERYEEDGFTSYWM